MLLRVLAKNNYNSSFESQVKLFCWTKNRATVRYLVDKLIEIDAKEANFALQIYKYRFWENEI